MSWFRDQGASPWRFSKHIHHVGDSRGRPRAHWRDYISYLAWKCLRMSQEGLKDTAEERAVWIAYLGLLAPWPSLG